VRKCRDKGGLPLAHTEHTASVIIYKLCHLYQTLPSEQVDEEHITLRGTDNPSSPGKQPTKQRVW